jgi:hypothetical protein
MEKNEPKKMEETLEEEGAEGVATATNNIDDVVVDTWDDCHLYEHKMLTYTSSLPSCSVSSGSETAAAGKEAEVEAGTPKPRRLVIQLYQQQTSFRALNTVGLTVWKSVRRPLFRAV